MNCSLQAFYVGSQPFQLRLSSHGFLEQHFDSLQTLLLIVQLAANHLIAQFSVGACLAAQVVQHLLWTVVLSRCFLRVHESLADRKQLVLVHLNRLR